MIRPEIVSLTSLFAFALGALTACSGVSDEERAIDGLGAGAGGASSETGGELAEGEGGESSSHGRYTIDPEAEVDKSHVFSTFRRTTDGTTQMVPRSTHICVLSDVQGDFSDPCHDNNCELLPSSVIHASGDNWALRRAWDTRNVGAICYRHSNFFGPPGSFAMWAESQFFARVWTGWPDCTHSTSVNTWHGDAITFINSVFNEFEGSGERVTVTQKARFVDGLSTGNVRTGVCFGEVRGHFGTYFVGVPGQTSPVFIGANDARLTAIQTGSEFSVGSNQTVSMARTDRAMCYLTRFSGDFNGNGERVRIFPQLVNGVERWHLQTTAGSGASAQANARCLAFDQTQLPKPSPD